MPDLAALDWDALDRLRAVFLAREAAASGPYWQNHSALAAYDATYGERIGWKWDALLAELRLRAWRPPAATTLVDFGCGSGVAGRRVLHAFGADHFAGLALLDHSPEAITFAAARARAVWPGLKVQTTPEPTEPFTLVVSHVLNELAPEARAELLGLAARAAAVLWVEPGTHADGRALAAVRDELRRAHRIVAPCTHRENCPLFAEANARDWCHFFAAPPPGVQNSPDWVRFSHRAGVDLRSQAYACLVLETLANPGSQLPAPSSELPAPGSPLLAPSSSLPAPASSPPTPSSSLQAPSSFLPARLLGRPEVFKPYARFLACDASGLHWLELAKRTDPGLVKRLAKDPPLPLYQLAHDGRKVAAATPLFAPPAPDADEDLQTLA
jgi:SAM-dependent methyltransferase